MRVSYLLYGAYVYADCRDTAISSVIRSTLPFNIDKLNGMVEEMAGNRNKMAERANLLRACMAQEEREEARTERRKQAHLRETGHVESLGKSGI